MVRNHANVLIDILTRHKAGHPVGITSICSAHPAVLEAACARGQATGGVVLVESTCNQVNHRGGYTGMTPAEFVAYARGIAGHTGLSSELLVLGGDHLGPSPWQEFPAAAAMDEARELVRAYVTAGYTKFHLDASMRLGGDPPRLPVELAAARTADLATVAEAHRRSDAPAPVYVIGTEVPIPGGAQADDDAPIPSRPSDAAATLAATHAAFLARGLAAAWSRVTAVVVQPGVEYSDDRVFDYQPAAAADLARFIESQPGLVFEAHSTDYQTPGALRDLVRDHFAVLKVGPALTFAYREAIFALEMIEHEWLGRRPGITLSAVRAALETAMLANPGHWHKYYGNDPAEQALRRSFSYSDRSRYYWQRPEVQAAVARLHTNLSGPLPLTLLSQFLPQQYALVRNARLANNLPALLRGSITAALDPYVAATGGDAQRMSSRHRAAA